MNVGRHWYFILSFSLSLGAILFCFLVFRAGQFAELRIGSDYLSGIPNYYFFYLVILPFISVGVIYLAFENRYIRFFGGLSDDLDAEHKARVLRFRGFLLAFAIIASILIAFQDALEKSTALPPYSFDLGQQQNEELARFFACQKQWTDCTGLLPENEQIAAYLEELRRHGYAGDRVSGFISISQWMRQSSPLYKLESLLSWVAALVISLLFVEVFLFMMVKNQIRPATKSLVIWMVVLASLWFPTKMYSSWYSNLGEFSLPAILWFGIGLLLIAILLVIFLKTARDDLYKYANVVTSVLSALVAAVSVLKPELIGDIIDIVGEAGLIYSGIFTLILMFSLYLVTDHFISNYEEEATTAG